MKLTNIKEGKIYGFKNIDSLNEDHIIVDFTNYKRPVLIDASKGIIEYRPLLNILISADEVKKAKN